MDFQSLPEWLLSLFYTQNHTGAHSSPRDKLQVTLIGTPKLWEMVKDRKAWSAAVLGITKSQARLSSRTTIFREGRENEPYFKENLRKKKNCQETHIALLRVHVPSGVIWNDPWEGFSYYWHSARWRSEQTLKYYESRTSSEGNPGLWQQGTATSTRNTVEGVVLHKETLGTKFFLKSGKRGSLKTNYYQSRKAPIT